MAPDGERSLLLPGNARIRARRDVALLGNAAMFAVTLGIGLLDDSWSLKTFPSWLNVHALFGLCLCAFVIAQFNGRVKHIAVMRSTALRECSRHLSRMVYLALYLVIGGKQLVAMLGPLWHDGTLACASRDCGIFHPAKDCKAILVCGVVALLVIRAMALLQRQRFGDASRTRALIGIRGKPRSADRRAALAEPCPSESLQGG